MIPKLHGPPSSTAAAVWSSMDASAVVSLEPSCALHWCRWRLTAIQSIVMSGCWCCLSAIAIACLGFVSSEECLLGWSCSGSSCAGRSGQYSKGLSAVGIANDCMGSGLSTTGISKGGTQMSLSSCSSFGYWLRHFGGIQTECSIDFLSQAEVLQMSSMCCLQPSMADTIAMMLLTCSAWTMAIQFDSMGQSVSRGLVSWLGLEFLS